MPRVEVSTRIEAETRKAIEDEAQRRNTSVAEVLRDRIEAGGSVRRMERVVEILSRTVGDLKAGLNRVESAQAEAAAKTTASLNAMRQEQARQAQATGAAIVDLTVALNGILAALKE